jgi:hypothetical protein
MAEGNQSGHASFAAMAAGFDSLLRGVKDMQLEQTGARRTLPEEPALHPAAAWSRAFGSHALRPGREAPLPGFVAALPETPVLPRLPPQIAVLDRPGGSEDYPGAYIGAALGKPGPRRSFLGRLFRG